MVDPGPVEVMFVVIKDSLSQEFVPQRCVSSKVVALRKNLSKLNFLLANGIQGIAGHMSKCLNWGNLEI